MKALSIACACLLITQLPAVSQTAAPDQRLREQIKQLTVQLRSAETEKATLQADKTNTETKLKTLEKEKADLVKKSNADKDEAKKEADKLRADIVDKDGEISRTKDLLVKADTFGKQSADLARKTETERSKLATENIELKRVVSDQRMRNSKMHEIAAEILGRYENFGLGTAITAREPFVGITRARLEALVEDYTGQIDAQRIRLAAPTAKPSAEEKPSAGEKPADRASDRKSEAKKSATKQ